jgi:anti-sigma regulatory factor (Ser/Thr protein kinase)
MILDPESGELVFANAGHSLPLHWSTNEVIEWRATGMPLGLMPGMEYEERSLQLEPGDSLLLYSDGLSEAHSPDGVMFGTPRIRELLAHTPEDETLIDYMFKELNQYTGPGWEQEDDVTFVTIERQVREPVLEGSDEQIVAEFEIASSPGNERQAAAKVLESVSRLELTDAEQKKLETATAEATMNAMEHGNKYDPEKPVSIRVLEKTGEALLVRITDQGGGDHIPEVETPDLDAKLSGDQSPRGWGLFLIKNMVDEMHIHSDDHHHTIELVVRLEEEG